MLVHLIKQTVLPRKEFCYYLTGPKPDSLPLSFIPYRNGYRYYALLPATFL